MDLQRGGAAAIVGAAALGVFGAALPDFLASGAPLGDDSSSHIAEILYIAELLRAGETDFWFDQTNLGYPLFLAYQPAPSLAMGALVALTRSFVSPLFVFKLSIVLVWSLMPITWYVGGRWLGLRRLEALLFALFLLAVNDFRAFGLGLSSALANGLYTQSWGALLLPLALGSLYRHLLSRTMGPGPPALLLSLTLLCHAFVGLFCGIGAVLMVVARREGLWGRAWKLLVVIALAVLASAFWLVPFLVNLEYQGGLPWKYESENGYPLAELLRWTVTGRFFDGGRLPWLTVLVVAGLGAAWRRRSEPLERWTLMLFAASFVLFMGRTNWGAPYDWIPIHRELEVIRYLSGLHFCGVLLAAIAASWGLERLPRFVERLSGPAWLTPERTRVAILGLLATGYLLGLHLYARRSLQTFDVSEPDFRGAMAQLSADTGSRFLSHKRLGTASHFYLNLLPALAGRPQLESYSRGYHDTLSLYYLEYFDFSATAFRLYNVGAALVRGDRAEALPDHFRETWSAAGLSVYESDEPGGYFSFVRTPVTLVADLKRARPVLRRISLPLFEVGVLPRLTRHEPDGARLRLQDANRLQYFAPGATASRDVSVMELLGELIASHANTPIRSRVVEERVAHNEYLARVEAVGDPERLLLKSSYHPYWTAAVDGQTVEVAHVAPNLMAVSVPAGRHEIRFRFRNPVYQKILFVVSLGGTLVWGGRRTMRGSRRAQRTPT
jgi:hypothetical protein